MWSIEINWNGRWVQVADGFKSRDDAEWATGKWKQSNQCYGDPFRAVEAPDPALDFATDAMHGPKDEADPLEADRRSEAAMSDLRFCEGCSQPEWNPHLEGCPVAAAPMSPEEQEKSLAHLDAAFEADRQKVISEVMGMVADPLAAENCPVCGQPNTPVHQEYEAAMASAERAVAVLP